MKDISSGIVDSLVGDIRAWWLPSIAVVGLFSLSVFPALDDSGVLADVADLNGSQQIALAVSLSVALAAIAAALSRQLYRVLEGYHLRPGWLRRWRETRHLDKRRTLRNSVESAADAGGVAERLRQYPGEASRVMSTRLGNTLRAGEDYGPDRYGLDTVTLWDRLIAVAPDAITNRLEATTTSMNTWVGSIWLAVLFSAVSVYGAIAADSPSLYYWAAAAVGLTPIFYAFAVSVAEDYGQALRALVDLSRGELAASLGYRLPDSASEERTFWGELTKLAAWGLEWEGAHKWENATDKLRAPGKAPSPDTDQRRSVWGGVRAAAASFAAGWIVGLVLRRRRGQ